MTLEDLIETTEGVVVLGGITLTIFSPIVGPEHWAAATGIIYLFLNLPNLCKAVKRWFNGNKD